MFHRLSILSTIALSAVALSTLSISPLHAGGISYKYVNCAAGGKDLQDVIDGAPDGDVAISIEGECSTGPYTISRPGIELHGYPDPATLSAPGGGHNVLAVVGVHAELRNLNIMADTTTFEIYIRGGAASLDNVTIEYAAESGIQVGNTSHAHIKNSEIKNNRNGIAVVSTGNAIIHGNTIHDNTLFGIVVVANSSATVQENIVSYNGTGLLVSKMSSVSVFDNIFEWNTARGVWVGPQYGHLETFSPKNTIENNGTDVQCDARGIFESSAQISNTQTTNVSPDCTVFGSIF